ncbi:MAG TPA: aldehyde dehydrogenase family protein [Candidatus Acidoferrales bacterium]|nr:aldehyde dehydrogenase family protein [Candidatus Acidoferrales bacterium]
MSAPAPSFRKSPAQSGDFVESIDPATAEQIARFQAIPISEIPAAFVRAREAQAAWAAMSLTERCAFLRRFQAVVFDRRKEIADIICRETGKPRAEAIFAEIMFALDTAGFLARKSPRFLKTQRVPHHNWALKSKRGRLHYEPLGLVALITPWNYPFAIPVGQVLPALVAGNAVLLKPSELTSWTGALIAELSEQAGAPAGLVQVLQGGGKVAAAIIEARPDKVFFTGSVETGRKVAEACGRHLIPSVLELGGKDPMVVLADADIDKASSAAIWGGLTNCGQACLSVERVYVERSVAERFISLCVQKTRDLRVGSSADSETDIGPMVRNQEIKRVEAHLRDAVSRGAKILIGGVRTPEKGANFFAPAIVTNVDHTMRLMREETFGPVIAIQVVADDEEAVRLANDSEFGLSASVWTRDAKRGRKIASRLRVGSVMVNDVASYYGITEAPHGGRGASGWGCVHSRLGLLEMTHVKYIDEELLPRFAKSWWYRYGDGLAEAADRFTEILFAPSWKRRWKALASDGHSLMPLFKKSSVSKLQKNGRSRSES